MKMSMNSTARAAAPIYWSLAVLILAACGDGDGLTGAGVDGTPRLSNHIVFATVVAEENDWDIQAIDLDTQARLILTDGPEIDLYPAVSPDGSQIAFSRGIRHSDGGATPSQIYLMNADGSGVRPITATPGAIYPAWSPDGTRIAFSAFGNGAEPGMEVWVMKADGSELTQLSTGADSGRGNYAPAWSPDGSKIAYVLGGTGGSKIMVMNADGSNPIDVLGEFSQWADGPTWSPDGSQIAYGRYFDGRRVIAKMRADGSNQVILSNGHQDYYPTWSPDGSSIAYTGRALTPEPGGGSVENGEIMVMSADGGSVENLTRSAVHETYPYWFQYR